MDKPYPLKADRGLSLIVEPNGTKRWELRYTLAGRDGRFGCGLYPDVSLAKACERRDAARVLVANGENPAQHRKIELAKVNADTVGAVVREWLETRQVRSAESTRQRIASRFDRYVIPYLGNKQLIRVTPLELLSCLKRVQATGHKDVAHRLRGECSQVWRYAIPSGRADRDMPHDLIGALEPHERKHFAALTEPADVARLMRDIPNYHGSPEVRAALVLSALLFQRPGEIRQMKWEQLNLDGAEWRYVVSKTKRKDGTVHIVPLPFQALDTLRELRPLTGRSPYVFPGARSSQRPLSNNAVRIALRAMGYTAEQMTAHGFRAMARSLLAEQGWPIDVIERQLSHKASGPLGAAYDRAKYLDERRRLMQAWADYLGSLVRDESKVVAINRAA